MPSPVWHGKVLAADRVKTVAGCVNVQWYGAKGSGLVGDVAVNDDAFARARAAADLTNRGLYFPAGDYYFSDNAPLHVPLARIGMEIGGDPGQTTLHYTGVGVIVNLDGGAAPIVGAGLYGCYLHDLILVGTITATIGVFARNFHQSRMVNVAVRDVTDVALSLETCTNNLFEDFACTVNRVFFAIQPDRGVLIAQRAGDNVGGYTSEANVFVNLIVEGLQLSAVGIGIEIRHGVSNTFYGGASQANKHGLKLRTSGDATTLAEFNLFSGMILVQNVTDDLVCAGVSNIFDDLYSQNAVTFAAEARGNLLRGGLYGGALVNASALPQALEGPAITVATFNDPLSPGYYMSNADNLWHHRLPGLPVFADNAAALIGLLVAGDQYRTAAGVLMVVF